MNLSSSRLFWIEQPALLLGISLLIGTNCALFAPSPWNWIFPFLWFLYLLLLRAYPPLLLLIGGALYALSLYPKEPVGNAAYFSISSLQVHQSPFHKSLLYKGMAYIDGQRVPCSVHFQEGNRPKADSDYLLKGTLKKRGPYDYIFRPKEWIPVKNTFSLAELRFQSKEALRKFLDKKLKTKETASFLASLLTGDVEDRMLRYQFGKLGLQHILAISGFHFAILISFFSFFLSLFLPFRWKIIALLLCINLYFLFIGSVPAVQRSWLMATLYLVGKLIKRNSSALNLLGVALLIEMILDPLVSARLGFQLSFLSCIGILLFRRLFIRQIKILFPNHNPLQLTPFSQHIYLLSTFFREALLINFAVNAAILPLLLFHFHTFPLLSLLYNLFFPFLISISLFLLLLSFLFPFLFPLVNGFTSELLNLASFPPTALDYTLKLDGFPAWVIPFYLFALFAFSLEKEVEREKFT